MQIHHKAVRDVQRQRILVRLERLDSVRRYVCKPAGRHGWTPLRDPAPHPHTPGHTHVPCYYSPFYALGRHVSKQKPRYRTLNLRHHSLFVLVFSFQPTQMQAILRMMLSTMPHTPVSSGPFHQYFPVTTRVWASKPGGHYYIVCLQCSSQCGWARFPQARAPSTGEAPTAKAPHP